MTVPDRSLNTSWLSTAGAFTGLLMAPHRIEIGPADLASRYSGHAVSAPKASSARRPSRRRSASHIPRRAAFWRASRASPRVPFGSPGSGSERARATRWSTRSRGRVDGQGDFGLGHGGMTNHTTVSAGLVKLSRFHRRARGVHSRRSGIDTHHGSRQRRASSAGQSARWHSHSCELSFHE